MILLIDYDCCFCLVVWYVARWNVEMPMIIAKSISILSDAGLGMAMFSLGKYRQWSSFVYGKITLFGKL